MCDILPESIKMILLVMFCYNLIW